MTRQLVFIHGRAQENRNAVESKGEWIAALKIGLDANGLELPITEDAIRFPYYGQTLYDLTRGRPVEEIAEVIVRGDPANENDPEAMFVRSVLLEIKEKHGITDEQVAQVAGTNINERGVLNWKWVQNVLRAIDTHVPGASSASVSLATRDVYLYLKNPGFQHVIDVGTKKAITPGIETVVVSHSLGTVVAYNILRRDGKDMGWKVPLFITLGSPLAVGVIKSSLAPIKYPSCVSAWYNAMDSRDVVSLYPLHDQHFRVAPSIINKTNVNNNTENRHGISGYLSDPDVAKQIYVALTR